MKTRSRVKRTAIIAGILLLLSPILIFGLSNLFLRSSKARSFISAQIEARTGLEASMRSASWSPWNGISCYGLSIQQPEALRDQIPEPLLTVRSIRMVPQWFPLMKKQLMIKELFVDGAELTLPAEILLQISHPTAEDAPAAIAMTAPDRKPNALNTNLPRALNPQIHAVKPSEINLYSLNETAPPQPAATAPTQLTALPSRLAAQTTPAPYREAPSNPSKKVAPPAISIEPSQPPIATPKKSSNPTVWVHCSNTSVKIVSSLTKQSLYEVQRIDGKIPISGQTAESNIQLSEISSFGKSLSGRFVIPLTWHEHTLSTKQFQTEFSGITCMIKAAMGLTHGYPFELNILVPEQNDIAIELPKELSFQLKKIAATGTIQGYSIAPQTWRGQCVAHAEHIDAHFGQEANFFEYSNAVLTYQGGVLRCIDARMIGDEMSILANAGALQDGRFSAIIRFVSTPERLNHIASVTHPEHSKAKFTPLQTTQRSALDLQIYGSFDGIKYQPDAYCPPIPFHPQLFNLD